MAGYNAPTLPFHSTMTRHGDPLVRSTDPPTSHAAAARIEPKEGTCLSMVLTAIREAHGLTCDEVCERTGLRWNNASRRITTLIRRDLVIVNGERDGQRVLESAR